MELKDVQNIHLIGVAGVSMEGVAKVLETAGIKVSGCDLTTGGHDSEHITNNLDLVIISQAISEQSPGYTELKQAQELGVPVKTRAWVIGRLMQEKGKIGVAIAGAHGKTTTTAMVGMILVEAGLDPTILNGGLIKQLKQSWRAGKGPHVVAEACEYQKQFLQFVPRAVILTNLDREHLDTFPKGLPQIIRAFRDFVKMIPSNGVLVINSDDKNLVAVAKSARCKVKTVTVSKPWPGLKLQVPGGHNILAATLAAKLCHELGVSHDIIKRALNTFTGVSRRLELVAQKDGILVYDDYGHHPAELETAFNTLKEQHPKRRLVVIFEPHQAARTKLLFDDFVKVLKVPDVVLLAPVFQVAGRDEKIEVSSDDLAKAVGENTVSLADYGEIVERLRTVAKGNDIVLTIGATKIYEVAQRYLE